MKDLNFFTIRKGENWFRPFKIIKIKEPIELTINQINLPKSEHWNKLFGATEHINPHKNSIRLGYRFTDKHEFAWYSYSGNKREIKTFTVESKIDEIKIKITDTSLYVSINGTEYFCHSTDVKFKWMTHSYWGGNPATESGYFIVDTDVKFRNKWVSLFNALVSFSPLLVSIGLSFLAFATVFLTSLLSDTMAIILASLYIVTTIGLIFKDKLNWQRWALNMRSFLDRIV